MIQGLKTMEELIEISRKKNLPFAIYSLPGENRFCFLGQNNPNWDQGEFQFPNGFVFAPFNTQDETTITLYPDIYGDVEADKDFLLAKLKASPQFFNDNEDLKELKTNSFSIDKEEYIFQVERIIEKIRKGKYSKVVLSRIKLVDLPDEFSLESTLKILRQKYPAAFVYLFFHPHTGIWGGASPETLLSFDRYMLNTVALAGTKSIHNMQIPWGEKELIEQSMVANYVQDCLRKHGFSNYSKTGPVSVKSGRILHLKTSFKSDIPHNCDIKGLISDLHPTPAVCGIPKNEVLKFIEKFEAHSRDYYSGYLGPISKKGITSLFVNLRSFRICGNKLALFVGGGITKDSIPEDEWNETELKAKTILSVLEEQTKLCEN